MATRATGRDGEWTRRPQALITNGNEADLFIVFALSIRRRLPRHHGVLVGAASRLHGRQEEDKLASAPAARANCCSTAAACLAPNVLGEAYKGWVRSKRSTRDASARRPDDRLAQGALDHAVAYTRSASGPARGNSRAQAVRLKPARRRAQAARVLVLARRGCATRNSRVPHRSSDVQDLLVGGCRAGWRRGGQPVRRLRGFARTAGVEREAVVSRREISQDLRRHFRPR